MLASMRDNTNNQIPVLSTNINNPNTINGLKAILHAIGNIFAVQNENCPMRFIPSLSNNCAAEFIITHSSIKDMTFAILYRVSVVT
jgi:hypothetical protein